jgi:peptide/nickel transport system permease protein
MSDRRSMSDELMDDPLIPGPPDMAMPTTTTAPGAVSERAQARRETLAVLFRRPAFIIGNIVVIGWVITAILGQRITPYDPFNDFFVGHLPPSPEHLMGTDRLGRDVLSRIMVGSRDVLIIAPLAAMLGVVAGTLLGLVMGYYRGTIDDVLSRLVEAFLALPVVLVALLTLVVLGTSPLVVVCVVGILFTPIVARTVRSAVLSERQLDYVTAAKLRGESGPFILSREIFPNVLGPTVVEMTVRFGYAIFTVATLSFLGVGLQPPSPDWGLTVSEEYTNMISGVWWPTLFPALAIASTVIAVNLVADSLQSVLSE